MGFDSDSVIAWVSGINKASLFFRLQGGNQEGEHLKKIFRKKKLDQHTRPHNKYVSL
jgi:hypothetical protein